MKYAVIKTGGKQYKISEGDVISVEHLPNAGKEVRFADVLLYAEDAKVQIGAPVVSGIEVVASLIGDVKGKKIRVAKFKAKARFRRVTGHRQSLTQVKIESIGSVNEKVSKEKKVPEVSKGETKKTVKKSA